MEKDSPRILDELILTYYSQIMVEECENFCLFLFSKVNIPVVAFLSEVSISAQLFYPVMFMDLYDLSTKWGAGYSAL